MTPAIASQTTATNPAPIKEADQPSQRAYPRMGETVMVHIAPGSLLRNNETGGFFAPFAPTPQTVTVTLLRRLNDGDLVLV